MFAAALVSIPYALDRFSMPCPCFLYWPGFVATDILHLDVMDDSGDVYDAAAVTFVGVSFLAWFVVFVASNWLIARVRH